MSKLDYSFLCKFSSVLRLLYFKELHFFHDIKDNLIRFDSTVLNLYGKRVERLLSRLFRQCFQDEHLSYRQAERSCELLTCI